LAFIFTKEAAQMNRTYFAARGAIGFMLGCILMFLVGYFSNSPSLLFSGYALVVVGAVGGIYLAWGQYSTLRAAIGFGIGFLIGGYISLVSFSFLFMMADGSPTLLEILLNYYLQFVLGFTIAGAVSAGLTRSHLISVLASARAFAIGSAIGGAVIAPAPWSDNTGLLVVLGILIIFLVGGVLSGLATTTLKKIPDYMGK
jgi:hypothetical protein